MKLNDSLNHSAPRQPISEDDRSDMYTEPVMSRRDLLKGLGAVAAVVLTGTVAKEAIVGNGSELDQDTLDLLKSDQNIVESGTLRLNTGVNLRTSPFTDKDSRSLLDQVEGELVVNNPVIVDMNSNPHLETHYAAFTVEDEDGNDRVAFVDMQVVDHVDADGKPFASFESGATEDLLLSPRESAVPQFDEATNKFSIDTAADGQTRIAYAAPQH